ncbi:MAG: four helix bundle protein [Desulfuromonadales bacterium]|nr:four helix bundle protein [Desulfuromonadales bacterium]
MGNAGRNSGGGFGEDSGVVVIDNFGNGNHRNSENHGKATTPSHDSHDSQNSQSSILIPRGDYQPLLSYQKSEVVYQITYRFCQSFLKKSDRTVDQMVQAARSGKQNIVEGSKAAPTSKEMEIKLTNVARASLEELLEDYRDFLKVRDFPIWDKDSKEALYVRKLGHGNDVSYETYRTFVETRPAEVVANIAICLVHQANYLLDQQLKRLEKDFLKDGGLRERMTKARLQARDQQRLDERRKG